MDDPKLDKDGKLIRWVTIPRCTECDYRNHARDCCRLQRCRWRDKRPDQYSERMRVTRPGERQ